MKHSLIALSLLAAGITGVQAQTVLKIGYATTQASHYGVGSTAFCDEVEKEIGTLGKKARDGKLALQDLSGGTFTISNLGMFGIRQFASILNQPQGCILSVGAAEQRAVVRHGRPVRGWRWRRWRRLEHRRGRAHRRRRRWWRRARAARDAGR